MRRQSLGPWFKVYGDVVDRKVHYTDAQFRAFIEALAWGVRNSPRGMLPSRRAVIGKLGQDAADFLFSEGDLAEQADGSIEIVGWSTYQSGVLSTERKSPKENGAERVDNSSRTVPEPFTNTAEHGSLPSTSISISTEKENGAVAVNGDERDSLDRFYELTQVRPWGGKSGSWLRDLEDRHGIINVIAALEVEAKVGTENGLLGRVSARLAKQAERMEQATVRAAEKRRREPTPEEAAFRAALVATGRYEPPVNGSRGGAMTKVGDVVTSVPDGSATSPVSAVARSVTDPAAGRGSKLTPSLPDRDRHPDGRPPIPDGQGLSKES